MESTLMLEQLAPHNNIKSFPAILEIKSGDILYKVTSIYADKGDFRALWEELIIKALQKNGEQKTDN